jgi:SpoVK/Ycf46/Vps4 family AAA+-type ATPase
MEYDSSFERLYAYLQDDASRKYVTEHFAISILSDAASAEIEMRQCLLPEAPLLYYRMIRCEENYQGVISRAAAPLRVDPRITEYMQGINRLDERLNTIVRPIRPIETLPRSHEEIAQRLHSLIVSENYTAARGVINLTGCPRQGKLHIASHLCNALGLELYSVEARRLQHSGLAQREIVPLFERESVLFPAAIYVEASDGAKEAEAADILLDDMIENLKTFFIVGSSKPYSSRRKMFVVHIPRLRSGEQTLQWQHHLEMKGVSLDGPGDPVVAQFEFESDTIEKVVSAAILEAASRQKHTRVVTTGDLWRACREQCRTDMEGLAQLIEPCFTWDDIVLPNEVHRQLRDIVSQVNNRTLVYEDWGFGAKLSRGRGISVLFSGPSGTGKTMAAEIMANHLELDLYRVDLAAVVSKYIGETEKNLRRVFDAAERGGGILFFDEADALFGKRSEVKDSHDRYANIEINYLLQRMEDYRGIAILATNRKSLLDTAFLRRLRFHVEFPFPSPSDRQRIWEKSFPSEAEVECLAADFLNRLEIPGGNIRNIALNAAFLAADEVRAIGMDHILRSAKWEYGKIGKAILESEFGSYYDRMKS